MRESKGLRILAYSRTLFMLFGVASCYLRLINVEWFTQVSVFVMAPWAIAIIIGELFHRQIRMCPYNALLFAMSCIFMLSSLYNRGILVPGIATFALFCAIVTLMYYVCRDTGDGLRDRKRRILCLTVTALCLVIFLPVFASYYNGHGWRFPWQSVDAEQVAGNMQATLAFAYVRSWVLSDLSVLAFVCSTMLVAGIVPKAVDTPYLRREGRGICAMITILSFVLLAPAVYSVFTGRPIIIKGQTAAWGISHLGGFNDRLTALQHSNATSHFALLGFFTALYCMYGHKKRWAKALLTVFCIVFLLALAHCQSRTTDIAFGLGLGALVMRKVFLRHKPHLWRIPVGIAAAVLVIPLTLLFINAIYTVDLRMTLKINAAIVNPQSTEEPAVTQEKEGRAQPDNTHLSTPDPKKIVITEEKSSQMMVPYTVSHSPLDLFDSGRGRVWQESIDYLIHHPKEMVVGMGAGRIVDRIEKYNRNRLKAYHLHNGFLETLARGGVFMLLCLFAALVLLVVPTAKLLVGCDPDDPGGYVFSLLIGMALAITMTEAVLFVEASLFNLIFFYAASRAIRYGTTEAQRL